MRKNQNTHEKLLLEVKEKKNYVSPILDTTVVEMECGIAANSAAVSPATVGGNTDQVQTDWNGNDDTTIDTLF
ncbi:hypothetical protein [Elizabethkingia anophelis]|uniref:hypothetical protein n=1 Tax=Elizabethkingia anophelis TaxID=1117645 RepID=UPI003891812D